METMYPNTFFPNRDFYRNINTGIMTKQKLSQPLNPIHLHTVRQS